MTYTAPKMLLSVFAFWHLYCWSSHTLILVFPSPQNVPTGEYFIHSRVEGDFACRRLSESVTVMDVMNSYLALTLSPLLHAWNLPATLLLRSYLFPYKSFKKHGSVWEWFSKSFSQFMNHYIILTVHIEQATRHFRCFIFLFHRFLLLLRDFDLFSYSLAVVGLIQS
jgi:hypothetical protein